MVPLQDEVPLKEVGFLFIYPSQLFDIYFSQVGVACVDLHGGEGDEEEGRRGEHFAIVGLFLLFSGLVFVLVNS